jgi:hypothetical protein
VEEAAEWKGAEQGGAGLLPLLLRRNANEEAETTTKMKTMKISSGRGAVVGVGGDVEDVVNGVGNQADISSRCGRCQRRRRRRRMRSLSLILNVCFEHMRELCRTDDINV